MATKLTVLALVCSVTLSLALVAIVVVQFQRLQEGYAGTLQLAEAVDLLLQSSATNNCRFDATEPSFASVTEVKNPDALVIYPAGSRYFIVTFSADAARAVWLKNRFGFSGATTRGLDVITTKAGRIIDLGWSKP